MGLRRRGQRKGGQLFWSENVVTQPGERTDAVTDEAEQDEVDRSEAKVTTYERHATTALTGQHARTEQRMNLHVPAGAFAAQVGDVATAVDSSDPLLVGRMFRFTQAAPFKEIATAYRCFVDEVTR